MKRKMIGGFSFIEILIVIGIIGILSAIIIYAFSGLRDSFLLRGEKGRVISLANDARTKTLSSQNDTAYGIHFDADQAVLFAGGTYATGTIGNEVLLLDDRIEISSIDLFGGGSDILFKRLTGETDQIGTVEIQIIGNASSTEVITINSNGGIE